ncbi:MAG: type I methionyl aminopeptidase [Propionicimonas sp.]|nr:type I methionyl aminopeptidase [Propionicimonas sp.]MEA4942861.1 type I methionyl aminopeptidase [Propionicimonas sp.]MEA5119401.1 type I methionyl aminopeptidase [Propionicimonas sp.]
MIVAPRIERKTEDQLRAMRAAGLVVARILEQLRQAARPGVTTAELDGLARAEIARVGAVSSFLGYDAGYGLPPFPAVTCISVNDEVVHGIPGPRVLVEGDLVSIDFGVSLAGWHGDSAITVGIGELPAERARLSEVTRQALWAGIAAVRAGGRIGDIGHAVEHSIRREPVRYGIVAEFTGHGIGTAMHMEPDVPNLGRRGRGVPLTTGMTIAIEPMVTLGRAALATLDDEWTVVTRDRSAAAHWEHTVAITERGLWVLTAADGGEAELAARGVPFGPLGD